VLLKLGVDLFNRGQQFRAAAGEGYGPLPPVLGAGAGLAMRRLSEALGCSYGKQSISVTRPLPL